jgi:hypothetical protein
MQRDCFGQSKWGEVDKGRALSESDAFDVGIAQALEIGETNSVGNLNVL